MIGATLLLGYLIWRGLFVDGIKRWAYDFVSIGLAAALTAVFWLPFIAERNAILLNVAGAGHFDFHNHFIPLSMLLSPSPPLDLGATTPKYIYSLGVVQWLLFIPAVILVGLRRNEASRCLVVFFMLATALFVFLITPASTFLWEAIPAATFVQFPWRFLGPAAFTLAMCVGYVFRDAENSLQPAGLARRLTPYVLRSAVLVALLIAALPNLYPPLWDANFGDTSPRGMIDFELSGVALGTTSTGDFLP